jgi:A/G-specific adenine glycosylase
MDRKERRQQDIRSWLPFKQSWPEFLEQTGVGRVSFRRFRSIIFHYYFSHRREFPWRENITPYRVFISEVMLQQTQTNRVVPKFIDFTTQFPDFQTLAEADFSEVLRVWKGLGYNRRARYLQEAAEMVTDQFGGELPDDPGQLLALPGIGPATAASICTFAFNTPHAFIETNIRTVYIHFFFPNSACVDDRQILPLVKQTIDHEHSREWYYALMDYGVMLKKTIGNLNRKSRHYSKQSRFEGSDRQLRGKILQLLLENNVVWIDDTADVLGENPERIERVVSSLCSDNLVVRDQNRLTLS